MKINILVFVFLALILLVPLTVRASQAYLVFDRAAQEEEVVAKKFRANGAMNASASGQFSAVELERLYAAIPVTRENVWIIDLRQESHGFINGLPISWYKAKNQANLHKTANEIERDEQRLLAEVRQQKEVTVYTVKKLGDGEIKADKPVTIIPTLVETEQQLVVKTGAKYKRIHVLDHHKPENSEVDDYVHFIRDIVKNGDWLHFHCRGGKGRSSTFIAMYDMIKNAHNTSFEEIMQRQIAMGNIQFDTLPSKPEKMWKTNASKERYEFLQKFYSYVVDPDGYARASWSHWLLRKK